MKVLGVGKVYPCFFAAVSGFGILHLLLRPGRPRRAGALLAAYVVFPPVAFVLQGTAAAGITRVYQSTLPFWAMGFASAVTAAAAAVVARARKPLRRNLPVAVLAGTALAVLAASGQVRAFLSWNHSVDPRRALLAVITDVRDCDDFAVIAAESGDPLPWGGGWMDWNYYAWAYDLYPDIHLVEGRDFPYLMRSRYYVVAADEATAKQALARSAVDPFLAGSMRPFLDNGRTSVFRVVLDEAVLTAYRSAASSPGVARENRAQALAGLGFDALRRDRTAEAISFLEKAKGLAPQDRKVRYWLGQAYYLALDDNKAGAEFEWIVMRDTENVHAPLYYADTLAGRGRTLEPQRVYSLCESWFLKRRARMAVKALQRGAARPRPSDGTPQDWFRVANEYYAMGSYERARAAVKKILTVAPSVAAYYALAQIDNALVCFAASAEALRKGLELGGGIEFKINLAHQLHNKYDVGEARRLVSEVLAADPGNQPALQIEKELDLGVPDYFKRIQSLQ